MNPKILPILNASSRSTAARGPSPFKAPDTDLGSCARAGRQQPDLAEQIEAAAGATDLFGRRLDRHQRAIADGFAVRRQNWVDWPVIGAGIDLPDGRAFDWSPHRTYFRNGTSVSVYVSISDGLCNLGKSARLSIAKIGISTRTDISPRMTEANADRYASIHEADGRLIDADGFDSWEPLRLPPAAGPAHDSPVERLSRVLVVSLPLSLTIEAFDAALTTLLDPCRLDRWINTKDGELHCARHDVDARALRRMTAHQNADGSVRLKAVRELYVFRRREDTDRLIAAIEGLIARHLLSLDDPAGTAVITLSKIRGKA